MGAGSYAINGAGGAAATGNGDVMMRFLPSYVFLNNLMLAVFPILLAQRNLSILFYINCPLHNVIPLRNVIITEVDVILIYCTNQPLFKEILPYFLN